MRDQIESPETALRQAAQGLVDKMKAGMTNIVGTHHTGGVPLEWCEEFDALVAALKQPGGDGWLPIESAPKDRIIFLSTPHEAEYYCQWVKTRWCMWGTEGSYNMGWVEIGFVPTHWMDRPVLSQQPKGEGLVLVMWETIMPNGCRWCFHSTEEAAREAQRKWPNLKIRALYGVPIQPEGGA